MPDRVTALESQVLHLRTEMRDEFSALRAEIRDGDDETREVLRAEIHAGDGETRRVLRAEIRAGDEETRRVLRAEIRAGDQETQRLMRVLHEDVIGRIAQLGEGGSSRT